MKTSITSVKKNLSRAAAILFWLLVWHFLSLAVNRDYLMASPWAVVKALLMLLSQASFWGAVWFSLSRIAAGFLLAAVPAVLLAALSARFRSLQILLSPMVDVVKATPVASFIILALLWVHSSELSIFSSVLMVFPVLYTNTLTGIDAADPKLLEMAKVFELSRAKRLFAIYIPGVMPYFVSGCRVGLGMCWKAGVAAEVIGLPSGSIGERLYQSKIYLETAQLFAWTAVIILASVLLERFLIKILEYIQFKIEGGVPDDRRTV
jgi:NitT/TauT family transport system permease protein